MVPANLVHSGRAKEEAVGPCDREYYIVMHDEAPSLSIFAEGGKESRGGFLDVDENMGEIKLVHL